MTKFVLPLLVFACAGFSQDKISQADIAKAEARYLAKVLKGASRRMVAAEVHDEWGNLDADLKLALETKLKLGMKRNKLTHEFLLPFPVWYSEIRVEVSEVKSAARKIGYVWDVQIGRFVKTGDGKHHMPIAYYSIDGGFHPTVAGLKDKIDTTLDTIFLAYLKLPEDPATLHEEKQRREKKNASPKPKK